MAIGSEVKRIPDEAKTVLGKVTSIPGNLGTGRNADAVIDSVANGAHKPVRMANNALDFVEEQVSKITGAPLIKTVRRKGRY